MSEGLDLDKIKRLFDKYDLNHNDTLEKKEFIIGFKEMLNEIGENMPMKKHEQVATEAILMFDLNGNRCIELNEFENLVRFLVSEKGYQLK